MVFIFSDYFGARSEGRPDEITKEGELDLDYIIDRSAALGVFMEFNKGSEGLFMFEQAAMLLHAGTLKKGYDLTARLGISLLGVYESETHELVREVKNYLSVAVLLPAIPDKITGEKDTYHRQAVSLLAKLSDEVTYRRENSEQIYSMFANYIGFLAIGFSDMLRNFPTANLNMMANDTEFFQYKDHAVEIMTAELNDYSSRLGAYEDSLKAMKPLQF